MPSQIDVVRAIQVGIAEVYKYTTTGRGLHRFVDGSREFLEIENVSYRLAKPHSDGEIRENDDVIISEIHRSILLMKSIPGGVDGRGNTFGGGWGVVAWYD